jgi:hypothetical protein
MSVSSLFFVSYDEVLTDLGLNVILADSKGAYES